MSTGTVKNNKSPFSTGVVLMLLILLPRLIFPVLQTSVLIAIGIFLTGCVVFYREVWVNARSFCVALGAAALAGVVSSFISVA